MIRKSIRFCCGVTLFFFACSSLAPAFAPGNEEDPLALARKLIMAGSYDEAARVLGAYIERIRDIAKQRNRVADAHYMLAKMYFEVGDDLKCDENLRSALSYDAELGKEETNADFRERLDKIRAEVAPRVFEKLKKAEERRAHPRKKFPWLLVAGVAVAIVLVVLLLKKKKNYTLAVTVGAGVTGTPAAGSYTYAEGTSVSFHYEAGADYKDLAVRINGATSSTSGTLVMNQDFRLEATATPLLVAGELIVDAKKNCFELVGSAAAMKQIPGGSYTLQISGNAYYGGSATFRYVLVRYCGSDYRFHLGVLNIPTTLNLHLEGTPPNSPFHAFFVDQQNVMDNSGSITLNFGSTQFAVHGRTNCMLIENLPASKITVQPGTYRVRASGSAFYVGSTPMSEVLVYHGSICLALSVGQTVIVNMDGSPFYAFLADWSGVNDNSGQIKLEFLK